MKLPKKIRIGPSYYSVIVEPLEGNLGLCYGDKGIIKIHDELTGEKKAATVLHEIIHGIIYEGNVEGLSEKMEERVVRAIESGLCGFAKDNQKLFIELVKEME